MATKIAQLRLQYDVLDYVDGAESLSNKCFDLGELWTPGHVKTRITEMFEFVRKSVAFATNWLEDPLVDDSARHDMTAFQVQLLRRDEHLRRAANVTDAFEREVDQLLVAWAHEE